jgi:hypothetical protein
MKKNKREKEKEQFVCAAQYFPFTLIIIMHYTLRQAYGFHPLLTFESPLLLILSQPFSRRKSSLPITSIKMPQGNL